MIEIRRYQLDDGSVPVDGWLSALRDKTAHAALRTRIRRVEAGNFGDCKPMGEGVMELRVAIGAGYRLYCARHGQTLVVLLCGGDKSSQSTDIRRAKDYWSDWKRRNV